MSWLSRVRSGIPFLPKRQSAENLWHKCSKCGTMVFVKEWEENYNVCPRCNFHDRIGPAKRFEQLFDAAQYELLPAPEVREDPLRFRDTKRYTDRLKAARAANGERDALVNARGKLDGHKVIIGVQDFAFMGGSMGIAVGAAFVAGVRAAIADQAPYIMFTAAGGARMQEGILQPDADATHDGRARRAQGSRPALYRRPHRPDDRRRHRILRDARRRPDRRARRPDRLRRPARDRADHPREAARRASSAPNICSSTA